MTDDYCMTYDVMCPTVATDLQPKGFILRAIEDASICNQLVTGAVCDERGSKLCLCERGYVRHGGARCLPSRHGKFDVS